MLYARATEDSIENDGLTLNRVVLFSGVKKIVMSNDAAEFSLRVLEWYEITP